MHTLIKIEEPCFAALNVVRLGIDLTRRFPRNVFTGDWSNFLFFDSDFMFEADYVKRMQTFLKIEGGTCVGLFKVDEDVNALFTITAETSPQTYQFRLSGTGPENGLIYDMGRFACASDTGDWCMYCERSNEIGVIAVRRFAAAERYKRSFEAFQAVPLAAAISAPLSYGFSSEALSAVWRKTLLEEYASRSR